MIQHKGQTVIDLPEDLLIHIMAFQEPDDQIEAGHVHRHVLSAVRLLKALPNPRICRECSHPERYCLCVKRAKRVGAVYFFFLVALVGFCFAYPFLAKN